MSYPSFVAAGTAAAGAPGNNLSVSPPSGIQRGDLLMLFVENANEAVTTPSGWTIAPNSPQGTGTATNAGAVRLSVFYKFSAATESNVTVNAVSDHLYSVMLAFRNVNRKSPFNTSAGSTLTAGTSRTLSSVTTTNTQCMIVNSIAGDADATGGQFSSWTNATTGAPTEQFDNGTTNGNGGGIAVATALLGVAGSTGSTTVTQATSVVSAQITYALSPETKAIHVS